MVHKLVEAGRIPARRYGRAVRIPWSWLDAQAGRWDQADIDRDCAEQADVSKEGKE
jgi:hypothetical protein